MRAAESRLQLCAQKSTLLVHAESTNGNVIHFSRSKGRLRVTVRLHPLCFVVVRGIQEVAVWMGVVRYYVQAFEKW